MYIKMECKESNMSYYTQLKSKDKWKVAWYICVSVFGIGSVIFLGGYVFSYTRHLVERSDQATVSLDEKYIQFMAYMKKFGKKYQGEKEFLQKFDNFKESLLEIEKLRHAHRYSKKKAKYGFTKFSDMSKEEFIKTMLIDPSYLKYDKEEDYSRVCPNKITTRAKFTSQHYLKRDFNIPLKFDWRDQKGAVGKVLDQGLHCSSCWAHSTVGIMESMVRIGNLTQRHLYSDLSVQELIDCSECDDGCRGGNPSNTMSFLCVESWTIVPAKVYPLTETRSDCQFKDKRKHGVIVSKMMINYTMPQLEIAHLVATHGPVTATVNAMSWMNYLGGVIQYKCSSDIVNHVVQIVGYNMEDPELPYFIIKNSYGTDWGDHGYVYIAMTGICGVGSQIGSLDVAII